MTIFTVMNKNQERNQYNQSQHMTIFTAMNKLKLRN